jgi:hypothetical protein
LATIREIISLADPGEQGTIILSGLLGYGWAVTGKDIGNNRQQSISAITL